MEVKEKLYNLMDEYVDIGYEIECMIDMLEMYEKHYLNMEKNEFQEKLRVIKIVAKSIGERMSKKNSELDTIVIGIK